MSRMSVWCVLASSCCLKRQRLTMLQEGRIKCTGKYPKHRKSLPKSQKKFDKEQGLAVEI
eukprot:172473-Amphidinium_carterae.1